MKQLKHLVQGEFVRLTKYNLFSASFAVAIIWIVTAAFLDLEELKLFLPFVFLMESSLMTALLVGAEMFYEKKEHTISSMLISPMREYEYMGSKIVAHALNNLIIFGVITLALWFLKDFLLAIHWLMVGVALVSALYVGVGLVLSYLSKDFTALLMNYILMTVALVFPSLLVLMGWAPSWLEDILFYSPITVTLRIMTLSMTGLVNGVQVLVDAFYVVVLSAALYVGVVFPRFKAYATRDLGV